MDNRQVRNFHLGVSFYPLNEILKVQLIKERFHVALFFITTHWVNTSLRGLITK